MPLLADPNRDYGLELLNLKPGQAVVFHDDLLHGGAINRSLKTRISLDFALLLH
jgi:ectoine hydroxylase-related dioxygenase (phytanoyl-CoA dioxygenase family)